MRLGWACVASVCCALALVAVPSSSARRDGVAEAQSARTAARVRPVNDAVFSPAGKLVATAQFKFAKLWDVADGRLLHTLEGHGDVVYGVAFSPDGKRLVTVSPDHRARIWDVASGRSVRVLKTRGIVPKAEFSVDGALVLTADGPGGAGIWDASDGRKLHTLTSRRGGYVEVDDARFSPDGKHVVTVYSGVYGPKDETLELWDVSTGRSERTFAGTGTPWRAVFSPDGRLLLAQSERWTTEGRDIARLWDVSSGRKLGSFPGSGAVFNPNGKVVATADGSGVQLWDVTTGRGVRTLPGRTGEPLFSPDGKLLVTRGGAIWDVASGRILRTIAGLGKTQVGAFSPNGKLLLSWGEDGTARIWDVASGRSLRTLS
jgi:WD40 repeat protein